MGETTAGGLPYPVGTDRVMDGDNAIQALAQKADTDLYTFAAAYIPANFNPAGTGNQWATGWTLISKAGNINVVANGIQVAVPGLYEIILHCRMLTSTATGNVQANIGLNSSAVIMASYAYTNAASENQACTAACWRTLAANDIVNGGIVQPAASAHTFVGGSNFNHLSARLLKAA